MVEQSGLAFQLDGPGKHRQQGWIMAKDMSVESCSIFRRPVNRINSKHACALQHAELTVTASFLRLAIFSVVRQGELLGLKWSDVDWKNNQIHIQRTFNNQKWYNTKIDASNR